MRLGGTSGDPSAGPSASERGTPEANATANTTTAGTGTGAAATAGATALEARVPFLPDKPVFSRLQGVPVSAALLALICAVSFLFGTLGQHNRGLLKASGSASPVRVPLYGPFVPFSGSGNQSGGERAGEEGSSGAADPSFFAAADAAAAWLRFLYRYVMATLLVVSSGELAVVLAAFYVYGLDLEARLLGSRRFGVLLAVSLAGRALWLAVANASWMGRWLACVGVSVDAFYRERAVGLRPGPAWLCLLMLVVFEKRLRGDGRHHRRGIHGGYVSVPAGEESPPLATGDAAEAAGESDASFVAFSFASRPEAATASDRVRVRLLGKIPVSAGMVRVAVAIHLVLCMGFLSETLPALVLGVIL